jgi:hypothetical protein
MRRSLLAVVVAACGAGPELGPDAAVTSPDTAPPDGLVASMGFGDLSGMCGVLDSELTSATPALVRATFTFARAYDDAVDRPLLTQGGLQLAETPNAGGSSGLSEIFAYEQLARCEMAALYKTETEIVYDTAGKITDLEVTLDGEKIGVSVVRAQTYPLGTPYTLPAAKTLLEKKLDDILLSSANVSAADRWRKQILAVLAYDAQAADTFEQAWADTPDASRADTIVVITTTDGADLFIYTNM